MLWRNSGEAGCADCNGDDKMAYWCHVVGIAAFDVLSYSLSESTMPVSFSHKKCTAQVFCWAFVHNAWL
jgi:hypothetical protein